MKKVNVSADLTGTFWKSHIGEIHSWGFFQEVRKVLAAGCVAIMDVSSSRLMRFKFPILSSPLQ